MNFRTYVFANERVVFNFNFSFKNSFIFYVYETHRFVGLVVFVMRAEYPLSIHSAVS